MNDIVENMSKDLDHRLKNKKKPQEQNLSIIERSGLTWLEKMTAENKIAIVPADKGGAILVIDPNVLRRKVLEKLNNEDLYQKIDKDPVHDLHKELFDVWIRGKQQGFVSAQIAKDVMGISE